MKWLIFLGFVVAGSSGYAQVFNKRTWNNITVNGSTYFNVVGILLPLIRDGKKGPEHMLRGADAFFLALTGEKALKGMIFETRPNRKTKDSFPSGAAMYAFSVATVQANFHPREAWAWYGGASIISASRLVLNKHFLHDVLAGAALGYLCGRASINQPEGLLLRPIFLGRGAAGLELTVKL